MIVRFERSTISTYSYSYTYSYTPLSPSRSLAPPPIHPLPNSPILIALLFLANHAGGGSARNCDQESAIRIGDKT
jgi:hypothetical protein